MDNIVSSFHKIVVAVMGAQRACDGLSEREAARKIILESVQKSVQSGTTALSDV
jgi:hypothetical protein